MTITDDKKLKDIAQEFSEKFTHLKIGFFAGPYNPGKGAPAREQLNSEKTIGEIRTVHTEGDLSIDAHQKVRTLERNFFENYGLNVQVFRKSGNLWLLTTATDDWTLAEQNRKGGSSELHFNEKYST